jgi:urease accessory protein
MKRRLLRILLPLSTLLFPAVVYAHPGTLAQHIFVNGVIHPFTGVDHLLAMLAIGMWLSASRRNTQIAMLPLAMGTIVMSMFSAGYLGVIGQIDLLLAATVLLLGALLAFRFSGSSVLRVGTGLGICFLHAYAHGIEATAGQPMLGYSLGIALSSAALIAVGLVTGAYLRTHHAGLFRYSGWALIMAGAGMMAGF